MYIQEIILKLKQDLININFFVTMILWRAELTIGNDSNIVLDYLKKGNPILIRYIQGISLICNTIEYYGWHIKSDQEYYNLLIDILGPCDGLTRDTFYLLILNRYTNISLLDCNVVQATDCIRAFMIPIATNNNLLFKLYDKVMTEKRFSEIIILISFTNTRFIVELSTIDKRKLISIMPELVVEKIIYKANKMLEVKPQKPRTLSDLKAFLYESDLVVENIRKYVEEAGILPVIEKPKNKQQYFKDDNKYYLLNEAHEDDIYKLITGSRSKFGLKDSIIERIVNKIMCYKPFRDVFGLERLNGNDNGVSVCEFIGRIIRKVWLRIVDRILKGSNKKMTYIQAAKLLGSRIAKDVMKLLCKNLCDLKHNYNRTMKEIEDKFLSKAIGTAEMVFYLVVLDAMFDGATFKRRKEIVEMYYRIKGVKELNLLFYIKVGDIILKDFATEALIVVSLGRKQTESTNKPEYKQRSVFIYLRHVSKVLSTGSIYKPALNIKQLKIREVDNIKYTCLNVIHRELKQTFNICFGIDHVVYEPFMKMMDKFYKDGEAGKVNYKVLQLLYDIDFEKKPKYIAELAMDIADKKYVDYPGRIRKYANVRYQLQLIKYFSEENTVLMGSLDSDNDLVRETYGENVVKQLKSLFFTKGIHQYKPQVKPNWEKVIKEMRKNKKLDVLLDSLKPFVPKGTAILNAYISKKYLERVGKALMINEDRLKGLIDGLTRKNREEISIYIQKLDQKLLVLKRVNANQNKIIGRKYLISAFLLDSNIYHRFAYYYMGKTISNTGRVQNEGFGLIPQDKLVKSFIKLIQKQSLKDNYEMLRSNYGFIPRSFEKFVGHTKRANLDIIKDQVEHKEEILKIVESNANLTFDEYLDILYNNAIRGFKALRIAGNIMNYKLGNPFKIEVDATNSGYQVISLILKSASLGSSCNLVENTDGKNLDMYSAFVKTFHLCLSKLQEDLATKDLSEVDMENVWLDPSYNESKKENYKRFAKKSVNNYKREGERFLKIIERNPWMKQLLDDRKLFKHPIMTYPYSVTRYGVKNGLKTYFYKYLYDNFDIVYEENDISSLAFMLSRFFYHNIIKYPEVIILKEICCSVAYRGLMVEYKTPYCQWFIAPRSRVKARVRVIGGRHNLVYYNHHKEIDRNELSQSLGAVFIHGGDAFIVHHFSLAMKSKGIEYFTIHDAFFVDSNYTLLLKPLLIKAYAALYKYDYLRKFILSNKLTQVEHTGVSKKDKELLTGNLLRFIKTSNDADYLKRSVRTANFAKFK